MLPYEQVLDENASDRGSNLSREKYLRDDSSGYWTALWVTLGSWVLSLLGPLSLLFPLLAVGFFLKLVSQRKLKAAGIVALATPCTVSVVLGISDYARGRATLMGMGYPGTGYHNIDPVTRCGRSTGGCIVMGNEWVGMVPYNMTVTALAGLAGPMPGTYRGAYPSENEAKEALKSASTVAKSDLAKDVFRVGRTEVRLDMGVGSQLLEKLRYDDFQIWGDADPASMGAPTITATIFEEDCVIVRIPVCRDWQPKEPSAAIVLIDIKKGRPFAYYQEGEYYHNFPPVPYQQRE